MIRDCTNKGAKNTQKHVGHIQVKKKKAESRKEGTKKILPPSSNTQPLWN